uniref:Response regulator transcription factor n=1 Tax=Neobacillus citreus TaxID=2833578 RepID=A0A942SYM3_9BACI
MTEQADGRRVAVIIEDDLDIRYLLEQVLTQAGFETVTTGNGEDGVRAVEAYQPLVTTLDVSLPGIDGFEVARRIRPVSSTYIVMISAMGDEIDVLQGLEAGADDYVVKPFRPRELRARLGAMLRRPRSLEDERETDASSSAAAPAVAGPPVAAPTSPEVPTAPSAASDTSAASASGVPATAESPAAVPTVPASPSAPGSPAEQDAAWTRHNGLAVDLDARVAQVDGEAVELTKTEFDLIATLLETRRRVRSKADLALALRNDAYVTTHYVGDADRRNVEVHMANLRRKLSDDPNAPRFVVTVRGVGYRLTGPGDPGFVG